MGIVYACGRHGARTFAWGPRPEHSANDEEVEALTCCIKASMKAADYSVEEASAEAVAKAKEEDGRNHIIFTVTGKDSCQIRLDAYIAEEKICVESKIRWGSAIEELLMLKHLNEEVAASWGLREEKPPEECTAEH